MTLNNRNRTISSGALLGGHSESSGIHDRHDQISLDLKAPSAPTTPRMTRDISTKTLPRNPTQSQQRRQPSRYRHRTERGRREKRDGSKSRDGDTSRNPSQSQQRRQPSRYRHRTERGR